MTVIQKYEVICSKSHNSLNGKFVLANPMKEKRRLDA